MIAVRCQNCTRRFALFCLGEGDPCPFCGKREIVQLGAEARVWIGGNEIAGRLISMEISMHVPVFDPPAIERVPITERTISIARSLVAQAPGEQEDES